MININS